MKPPTKSPLQAYPLPSEGVLLARQTELALLCGVSHRQDPRLVAELKRRRFRYLPTPAGWGYKP